MKPSPTKFSLIFQNIISLFNFKFSGEFILRINGGGRYLGGEKEGSYTIISFKIGVHFDVPKTYE